jgi:predicted NUDIX family phosphoesterase
MAATKDERVLVVQRSLFDELGAFQGVTLDTETYIPTLLDPRNYTFCARSLAEDDPSMKQIIPYFIITHKDRIWSYVRGKKSGEERLVAKTSIGIGGHINDEDIDLFEDLYERASERELSEEVVVPEGYTQEIVALLNDDSNDVGKVHLGIIHIVRCPTPDVSKRESLITDGGFKTLDELREMRESLETWSQLCLDSLDSLLG